MAGSTLSISQYQALAGEEIGVSDWFDLDQRRIDAFADTTLDKQFIHVDQEAAKASAFGGTIAHGFLTLSMLSVMAQQALPVIAGCTAGVNYGFNSVRFVSPVRSGKRIRGRFVLKDVKMKPSGNLQSTLDVSVEIEGEPKPALVAEWVTLFYF